MQTVRRSGGAECLAMKTVLGVFGVVIAGVLVYAVQPADVNWAINGSIVAFALPN